jgi:hypothetical protein
MTHAKSKVHRGLRRILSKRARVILFAASAFGGMTTGPSAVVVEEGPSHSVRCINLRLNDAQPALQRCRGLEITIEGGRSARSRRCFFGEAATGEHGPSELEV